MEQLVRPASRGVKYALMEVPVISVEQVMPRWVTSVRSVLIPIAENVIQLILMCLPSARKVSP
jgi:hypothetical protein